MCYGREGCQVIAKPSLALVFHKQRHSNHVTPKQLSGHHHQPEKPESSAARRCVAHTPAPSGPVLCPFNITQTAPNARDSPPFLPVSEDASRPPSPLGSSNFLPISHQSSMDRCHQYPNEAG
ncbi:hypothetical protein BDP55DRAFT_326650 [Colletotrichum godetiae]|uniref:Uncharacterized protein n=1 Tax=Colletotrichum godetiae TaxID=1209918 RepID=A0AAJ0ABD6_9PEZI|nr:uncharacterized protein BDP55DRAFT_326650 [Colletotrichum godetiae]KAK1659983.1 hypothetical protein BDP55DRAFT_326650 [Colletotrichum godetiae]